MCIPTLKFQNMPDLRVYVMDPYFLIQFTGYGYMIKRIFHLLTTVIKFYFVTELAKSLLNIFQDWLNEILSQQLTHDRSYMCLTHENGV